MHRLFISQNPKSHAKEPYTQKWITILSSTCTGSLSNSDAGTIWDVSLNGRMMSAEVTAVTSVTCLFCLLPPRPWASGAPLSVLWLSGGGGPEAVATRSRSNNGTQHLPGPVSLKNDIRPTNELRQIRSRASWEFGFKQIRKFNQCLCIFLPALEAYNKYEEIFGLFN